MTKEEAEEIINAYNRCEELSCSCHMGNPPCGKCENMPPIEIFEEALVVFGEM